MTSTTDPADDDRVSHEQDRFILHITSVDAWTAHHESGNGRFSDPSLGDEGFIHCSTVDQFLMPANERFGGRHDLVLLVIDAEALDVDLVYEDCYESGTRFPHVYGSIPLAAVVDVIDFRPGDDGRFSEPDDLRSRLAGL